MDQSDLDYAFLLGQKVGFFESVGDFEGRSIARLQWSFFIGLYYGEENARILVDQYNEGYLGCIMKTTSKDIISLS